MAKCTSSFNNAGIGIGGYFEDIPEETMRKIIDVNLVGVIYGIYACLPLFADSTSKCNS